MVTVLTFSQGDTNQVRGKAGQKMKTATYLFTWLLTLFLNLIQVYGQDRSNEIGPLFNPSVSVSCQGTLISITVTTDQPFNGIVHTRYRDKDFRNSACSVAGNGESKSVTLKLDAYVGNDDSKYCGVIINKKTDDKKVTIAVRIHKTLEVVDDKYFTVSCNQHGFKNTRFETSTVSLKFLDDNTRVNEVYLGRQYTLRAESSKPDGIFDIKIIRCFAVGSGNDTEVPLIDSKGCPVSPTITKFSYDKNKGYADATIFSMFKFADSRQVAIQCNVMTCSGGCPDETCPPVGSVVPSARMTEPVPDNEGFLMIATSVYVLEPGEESPNALALTDCSIHRWSWLLGLCIAFGVLFVIMLIINIFLCSALTCTCTRQEIIEKEPSVIEDYDPYKGGWTSGSQYGSRYSLHGKPGYTSGGSTLNSTTRSVSTNSDHYAIVHSHPGSRYSTHGSTKGGPGSTLSNGQYNHAYTGRL